MAGCSSARAKLRPPDAALNALGPERDVGTRLRVCCGPRSPRRARTPKRTESFPRVPRGPGQASRAPRDPGAGRGRAGRRTSRRAARGAGAGPAGVAASGRPFPRRGPGQHRASHSPVGLQLQAAAAAAACACEMRRRAAGTRAAEQRTGAASSARGARCMRPSTRAPGSRRPRRLHKHLFRTRSPR